MATDSNEPILQIRQLRKSYGSHCALDGVCFSLMEGERLALLGPNGAGKTTLIRCLSGRTRPDSGDMELLGHSIAQAGVRDLLGLVPQEIALYGDLTTRENLRAFARFHGMKRRETKQRVEWALQWTGLSSRANSLVGNFSGGMKRRVNIACGVMHRPSVLLLDEPTVGVDPQSRERIFTMLDELSQQGTSILLTTHHLEEAEQRSDRILILDHGKIVADGSFDQLVRETVGTSRLLRLRVDPVLSGPLQVTAPNCAALGQAGDNQLSARIDDVSQQLPLLIDAVGRHGYSVSDVEVNAPSLHHVFLHLTGNELRE